MEYFAAPPGSLRLDVGRPHHLAPLLGVVGDDLGEIGRRAGQCGAADVGESRLHLGIGEARRLSARGNLVFGSDRVRKKQSSAIIADDVRRFAYLINTDEVFGTHNGFADPDFGPREVAAVAGISLRYLQKLFTAHGSTCSELIYSLRLDHAARLLHRRASLGTSQPLSEIAYACGFRDYTHFARKFRQRFGYSPGAAARDTVALATP